MVMRGERDASEVAALGSTRQQKYYHNLDTSTPFHYYDGRLRRTFLGLVLPSEVTRDPSTL